MSLRIFNENNYCTNGATLAISVWGKSGLGYVCPITGHSCPMKRITLNQYCLRGITSFRIRLDLVLFLFQNKEVAYEHFRTWSEIISAKAIVRNTLQITCNVLWRLLKRKKCRYEQRLSNLGFPERPYKND